ncbi:tetratricopeptide repeat protein [Calditrichota bacterium]
MMNKNIQIIFLCYSLLFLFPQPGKSNDWIKENIELTINGKFTQALDNLYKLKTEYPEDYRISFYLAATLNSRMIHFENIEDEQDFNKYIDQTINLIERELEKDNLNDSLHTNLLFYLGSAFGYKSYFEGKKGNWYSALSNGLKAKNLLYEAIEIDSTFYEAYFGIGTYKYWASSKIEFALWIPFIPDDRDEGIKMIKKSIENESPTQYMAMHQLVYILLDYGQFDEAINFAEKIVEKYPDSQFMWWANAHTYYKLRNYDHAIQSYNRLLDLFEDDPNNNPTHFIKCNLKLAQLHYELKDYNNCIRFCNNLLNKDIPTELEPKLEDEFDEAKEYLKLSTEQIKMSN